MTFFVVVRTVRRQWMQEMPSVRLEDGGCGRNFEDFGVNCKEVLRGVQRRHNYNRILTELEIGLILVRMSREQVLV